MLEFFYCGWQGEANEVGQVVVVGEEGGGGAFGYYLASPAKPALTKKAGLTVLWKLEILIPFAYILH